MSDGHASGGYRKMEVRMRPERKTVDFRSQSSECPRESVVIQISDREAITGCFGVAVERLVLRKILSGFDAITRPTAWQSG
jgi:hypothetical protein